MGVHYRPPESRGSVAGRPWIAQITANDRVIYLGCFATEEYAADAYLAAKAIYHGGSDERAADQK
jgi:hypothetical protein